MAKKKFLALYFAFFSVKKKEKDASILLELHIFLKIFYTQMSRFWCYFIDLKLINLQLPDEIIFLLYFTENPVFVIFWLAKVYHFHMSIYIYTNIFHYTRTFIWYKHVGIYWYILVLQHIFLPICQKVTIFPNGHYRSKCLKSIPWVI